VDDTGCPSVDFSTIQPAIDAAAPGDVILVRPRISGASYPPFDVDGKSLSLVGDGRGKVYVQGTSSIRNLGATQSVLVQGFAGIESLRLQANAGPVWIEDCFLSPRYPTPDSVTVIDCTSVLFVRCWIYGASGGSAMVVERSRSQLYDTNVVGGTGNTLAGPGGPGIEVLSGTVALSGCSVTGGWGASGSVNPRGVCYPGGSGGVGLRLTNIRGCTFVANTAPRGGAIDLNPGGLPLSFSVDLTNSVVWWNAGPQIALGGEGVTLNVSYCDIEGGQPGILVDPGVLNWGPGNLSVDPSFVNPGTGNYRLGPLSPCIDAGDPSYVPLPGEVDFEGEPRLNGVAVDIGADETSG